MDKDSTSGIKTNIFMDCSKMEPRSLEISSVPKLTTGGSSKTAKRWMVSEKAHPKLDKYTSVTGNKERNMELENSLKLLMIHLLETGKKEKKMATVNISPLASLMMAVR